MVSLGLASFPENLYVTSRKEVKKMAQVRFDSGKVLIDSAQGRVLNYRFDAVKSVSVSPYELTIGDYDENWNIIPVGFETQWVVWAEGIETGHKSESGRIVSWHKTRKGASKTAKKLAKQLGGVPVL